MEEKPSIKDLGDRWVAEATYKVGNTNTDPTTLTVTSEKPDGTETPELPSTNTSTLGPSTQPVSKPSTGVFRMNPGIELDQDGLWAVKFDGGGAADATVIAYCFVRPDPISVELQTYAHPEELKAAIDIGGTGVAAELIPSALVAASRGIDAALGRRFYADANNTQVRYFTADAGSDTIPVDDVVDVSAIATDYDGDGTYETSWVVNTDYVLEPRNAVADGRPYTRIRRSPRGRYFWPAWNGAVRVTGKFGWSTPPAAVKQLTILVASRLLRRTREAPFGIVAFGVDGAAIRAASLVNDPEFQFLAASVGRSRLLV